MHVYLLEEQVFGLLELDFDEYQTHDMKGDKAMRFREAMRKFGWSFVYVDEGELVNESADFNWAFPHPQFNDRISPLRSLEKVSFELRTTGWMNL